jgi:5-methylcytosine-specific restriction protein B
LKLIKELLDEKKQIIFYGPPGTSKTYVAKKFSEYFVHGKKENVEILQFHPSYSYEDFVEGIKPRLSIEGEATGFIKQPGILKNLVEKCIINPDENFVLIIDEINRGNISKIFGELIYLLEYRNEKVHLTYSPNEEFYIPDNLYIIGTMNSADRSIAFVDYALRRRFYFIDFYPDAENQDILKKWFVKKGIKQAYQNNVSELMREINIEISTKLGREYQIGYSYFMHELDYEKTKRIIDYAIIPLVEQYFFGKKENVDVIKNICNTYLIRLQDVNDGIEKSSSGALESFS